MGPATAGRLLAQRGLRAESLEAYDQAIAAVARVSDAGREVEARQRLARELIPLDPLRAAAVLEGGQSRTASPVARRMTDELIARLRASAAPAPGRTPPTSTPTAPVAATVPDVTVVIPCYKQAHYLPEAVASVVAQTWSSWEIVVVDDGSPDDTAEVAGRLAAQHGADRVRLLRQENRGLPAARNAGFRAARGRYVLPLDADDRIKPTLLARLVEVLERQPEVGFAYSEIEHFGARDDVHPLPDFDRAALYRGNIACVCALVRRAAWEQVGGYDEAMREGYEDWDFWITLARAGWEGHCTHLPLFLYRKTSESMLRDANRKQERLLATIVAKHAALFDERTRTWAGEVLARHRGGPTATPAATPTATPGATPRVSVVIPCHGQARQLPMAVASVAAQTFRDWELIVVDDGSPDESAEVAAHLLERLGGRPGRLLRQARAGLAAALDAGVAAARGAYVLPLDAGDAIDAGFLEKTVAVLDGRPEVHIVGTDGLTFGAREERIQLDPVAGWPSVHQADCLFPSSLYRREAWTRVGGYGAGDAAGREAWAFWVGCRDAGLAVAHVREPLFYRRLPPAGAGQAPA
jgi:glycosyltransferase involved in cell wall biosynthesis